jgi:hypothetical protein
LIKPLAAISYSYPCPLSAGHGAVARSPDQGSRRWDTILCVVHKAPAYFFSRHDPCFQPLSVCRCLKLPMRIPAGTCEGDRRQCRRQLCYDALLKIERIFQRHGCGYKRRLHFRSTRNCCSLAQQPQPRAIKPPKRPNWQAGRLSDWQIGRLASRSNLSEPPRACSKFKPRV